jgi:hypothetical protein
MSHIAKPRAQGSNAALIMGKIYLGVFIWDFSIAYESVTNNYCTGSCTSSLVLVTSQFFVVGGVR